MPAGFYLSDSANSEPKADGTPESCEKPFNFPAVLPTKNQVDYIVCLQLNYHKSFCRGLGKAMQSLKQGMRDKVYPNNKKTSLSCVDRGLQTKHLTGEHE